ncbi:MAG TPA: hypothetical protein VK872_12235, partial [Draconibacterium sp.]|nr:hypothetical protein [Draconibacterium sp.]
MNPISNLINLLFLLYFGLICALPVSGQVKRDPLIQPFSSNSIWNMPIGENAVFVHAQLEKAMAAGMTIDEDIIVT